MLILKHSRIEECLENWVFALYCIETQSFFIVNEGVTYHPNYQTICRFRLDLERESGLHYDIRAINKDNI